MAAVKTLTRLNSSDSLNHVSQKISLNKNIPVYVRMHIRNLENLVKEERVNKLMMVEKEKVNVANAEKLVEKEKVNVANAEKLVEKERVNVANEKVNVANEKVNVANAEKMADKERLNLKDLENTINGMMSSRNVMNVRAVLGMCLCVLYLYLSC